MSDQNDSADKSFEPTPHKLQQARKKGEVAKSVDLMTAAAYAGLTLAFLAAGAQSIVSVGTQLQVLIDRAFEMSDILFAGGPQGIMGAVLWNVAKASLPIFLLPALAVIAAVTAQRAFVFAPTKLAPKMSRVSVIQNAKQKFGRSGIFEFAKSFAKLLLYSICLAVFLSVRLPEMIAVADSAPGVVISLLGELCIAFLLLVVVISATLGAVDAVWQHQEHRRKNMMSRKEIMDETKNSEGDPHLKQERRARGQAIAAQQMMADVPKADVVIVNPTHYAVALKWSRTAGSAPTCVAKGVDAMAMRIREVAAEAAVPIHSDPPTARALFASLELGDEIAETHYPAVAAAIRFADAMRARARHGV
ncbi:MAG: flagellar type III secretion system protein FlhB [Pseudomonadota bacterium]